MIDPTFKISRKIKIFIHFHCTCLAEEGVEAVDLLFLLHESVVLRHSEQSELVHQVDLVGLLHVLLHERGHRVGERGRVEHDLSGRGQMLDHVVKSALHSSQ